MEESLLSVSSEA